MMPPLPEVSIPCTTNRTAAVPAALESAYSLSWRSSSSGTVAARSSPPAALSPSYAGVERGSHSASTNPGPASNARVNDRELAAFPDVPFAFLVDLAMYTLVASARRVRDLTGLRKGLRWKDGAHARAPLRRRP